MRKSILFIVFFLAIITCLQAQNSKTINLISYNIRYETVDDKDNNWPNRKEDLVAQVIKYKADILCLQEDLEKQAKFVDEQTGLTGTLNTKTKGNSGFYNGIYYNNKRFSIEAQGHFYLNEGTDTVGRGWDAASFRFARWVRFFDKETQSEFYVFNTHFDHKGIVAREESAKLMLSKIEEIAGSSPVILTGDFNSKPETNPIKTLKVGLKDSRDICKTKANGPFGTFNSFKLDSPLSNRIDYIFIKNNVVVNTYEVSVDKTKTGNYISDHLPVIVNLTTGK